MLIEIHCNNFSKFDPETGQYLACGEKLIVSDELIGQFVNCSKCSQQVEVPYGAVTTSEVPRSPELNPAKRVERNTQSKISAKESAGKREQKTKEAKKSRSPRSSSPAKAKSKSRTVDKRTRSESTQAEDLDLKLAEPISRQRADVMSMDFTGQPVQSTLAEDAHDRCSKCGNISESGKCTVCRYVEQNFEKLHQPLDDVKIELAGFQRWFCRTMNEGVSLRLLEYGAHIGIGLVAMGVLSLAVASIVGIAFGVVPGIFMLLITVSVVLLYVGMIYKGKQFRRDPRAHLAWFQKPFWNLILLLARSMNWEKYDNSLADRRIIKVREKMFGDNELTDLEGFKNCQVLDLQGTSVTDRGLLKLYALKHLQCLVLKRTNVSNEAVFRLQQSFPRLWIWH